MLVYVWFSDRIAKTAQGKWGTDPHSFLWMSGVGACLPSGPHSRQAEECGALNQTSIAPGRGQRLSPGRLIPEERGSGSELPSQGFPGGSDSRESPYSAGAWV